MKVQMKAFGGKFLVEFEASDTKTLVEEAAAIQELEQDKCGACKSTNLRFVVRQVDDDKYYEIKCKDCGFKLGLGIPKKGKPNLYPRRRNQKTKEPIGPKGDGWHKFENDRNDEQED